MTAHVDPDLSMADYHANAGWGSSDLKAMRLGPPAMVPWRKANPSEDTDATRLGTAVHCAILEPHRFPAIYAHKPEGMTFASKEGKAWRDDPCRASAKVLTHDEWCAVEQIVAAFDGKGIARDALGAAEGVEASVFWNDPMTGEKCKGRPDWFDSDCVYDLKVSRHAVEASIAFRAYAEGWMHQLAHYRTGLYEAGVPVRLGRLVVIGPQPPQAHRVFCIEVKEAALDVMAMENALTVKRLQECRLANDWPGTLDDWVKVEPPASALLGAVAAFDIEGAEEVA
jgi:exodeoxyribonuclease VIII